jgi:hypothetical protein
MINFEDLSSENEITKDDSANQQNENIQTEENHSLQNSENEEN